MTKAPSDPITPAEEGLVADLAGQAGLVLRNAALIEDLRASRQRLVAAQDEERRRLERNLHDGAQQQLVALAVKIRLLERAIPTDPDKAVSIARDVGADAGEALENLRRFDSCRGHRKIASPFEEIAFGAPGALARMRRDGRDPISRPEAKKRLGQANTRRREEAAAWDAEHERPDPGIFRREILPGLAAVSLGAMMRATGLSKRYVWLIRQGGYVPHPRHWGALRSLVTRV